MKSRCLNLHLTGTTRQTKTSNYIYNVNGAQYIVRSSSELLRRSLKDYNLGSYHRIMLCFHKDIINSCIILTNISIPKTCYLFSNFWLFVWLLDLIIWNSIEYYPDNLSYMWMFLLILMGVKRSIISFSSPVNPFLYLILQWFYILTKNIYNVEYLQLLKNYILLIFGWGII